MLDRHGDVIRAMLGAYLDHLAVVWRASGDSASAVASVLDGSCRPFVAPRDVQSAIENQIDEIVRTAAEHPAAGLNLLRDRLSLSLGEELLVAASWWAEVDPQLAAVFGVLHDDGTRRHPSSGLIHTVAAGFGIETPVHPRRLIDRGVVESAGPTERLRLTPTAREVVAGQVGRPDDPDHLPRADAPERESGLVAALTELVAAGGGAVLLRGEPGSGRHRIAADALARLGLVAVTGDRPVAELRLVARLGLAAPVVDADDALVGAWRRGDGPLVVVAGPDDGVDDSAAVAHVLDIPPAGDHARRAAWRAALERVDLADPVVVARLADQFRFVERDVAASIVSARVRADLAGRPVDASDVWAAAQQRPDGRLAGIATRVEPVYALDDLVLPAPVAERLREIVTHVEHRTTVLDEWGFRRRLSRGSGVAALFSGPPGTGKTTAAEAIAHRLGTALFRVDLSRVVSKYIGETEKHLAIAFREAERSGALLLFDEADALFGKRTEVRDSHDRYANLEVSYLLQRVETFTGLVILSTNRPGNVDDAFQRRLRFVVRFEQPTAPERAELWRRSFPSGASLGDLDWEALAKHDLAGGHIQSAAVSAAFLAAGNGRIIEREHVEHALAHEYEKLDRAPPTIGVRP